MMMNGVRDGTTGSYSDYLLSLFVWGCFICRGFRSDQVEVGQPICVLVASWILSDTSCWPLYKGVLLVILAMYYIAFFIPWLNFLRSL